MTLYPSEDYEGACFALWLDQQGYLFSHLAQNTFTRSYATKAKLKRAGVKPGVPDYCVLLHGPRTVFIEMKRVKGGVVSKEQKEWIKALNERGTPAAVCRGFEEAKAFIVEQESLACLSKTIQNEGEDV